MKFIAILILALSVIAFNGCRPRNQQAETTAQTVTESVVGFGNMQNPHFGKTTDEIPELAGGTLIGSMFMDCWNFGFHVFDNINGDRIYVFWDETNGILDTINLGKLNDNEISSALGFRENGQTDQELFGIITNVIYGDRTMSGQISRVWRADRNTGRISPVDISWLRFFDDYFGELQPPSIANVTAGTFNTTGVIDVASLLGRWRSAETYSVVLLFDPDNTFNHYMEESDWSSFGTWSLSGNTITLNRQTFPDPEVVIEVNQLVVDVDHLFLIREYDGLRREYHRER